MAFEMLVAFITVMIMFHQKSLEEPPPPDDPPPPLYSLPLLEDSPPDSRATIISNTGSSNPIAAKPITIIMIAMTAKIISSICIIINLSP